VVGPARREAGTCKSPSLIVAPREIRVVISAGLVKILDMLPVKRKSADHAA
jgi:hypothetical protein